MGEEARFQAIPEDCELLKRARQDREIAELIESFHGYALGRDYGNPETPAEVFFRNSLDELIHAYPGLVDRYYYGGGRNWDKIIYLLSPERRDENAKHNHSIIRKVICGSERLHPDATAPQGYFIGFVPSHDVQVFADFLDIVTYEQLHEHYDPAEMWKRAVYKMSPDASEESRFQYVWDEFTGMRDVYRQAALHNEAMITVID